MCVLSKDIMSTTTDGTETTQSTLNGDTIDDNGDDSADDTPRFQPPRCGAGQLLFFHDPDTPLEVIGRRAARLEKEGLL